VIVHARGAPFTHQNCDLGSLACQISVPDVDADLPESHDPGGIKEVHDLCCLSLRESLAQCCCCVRKPAHLKQLSSPTCLKDVQSPSVMLTLCGEDALLRDLEGLIEAIQNRKDIAQPLRGEEPSSLHDSYVLGGQTRIQSAYLSVPACFADEIERNRK
jgi:hypothetical protein